MTESKEVQTKESTGVSSSEKIAISLVYRGVPKDKRKELEKIAKEFTKKYRKLVNYIEK